MTKPIAEQVAELEVGDWVEARFERGNDYEIIGAFFRDNDGILFLDSIMGRTIKYLDGTFNEHLVSIRPVPRPIPSEPEVGSFAFGDGNVYLHFCDSDLTHNKQSWASARDRKFVSWPEIYPHITRLYTPSGDLVTGFEYYKGENNV